MEQLNSLPVGALTPATQVCRNKKRGDFGMSETEKTDATHKRKRKILLAMFLTPVVLFAVWLAIPSKIKIYLFTTPDAEIETAMTDEEALQHGYMTQEQYDERERLRRETQNNNKNK
jgi:hypothetical protein